MVAPSCPSRSLPPAPATGHAHAHAHSLFFQTTKIHPHSTLGTTVNPPLTPTERRLSSLDKLSQFLRVATRLCSCANPTVSARFCHLRLSSTHTPWTPCVYPLGWLQLCCRRLDDLCTKAALDREWSLRTPDLRPHPSLHALHQRHDQVTPCCPGTLCRARRCLVIWSIVTLKSD